MKRGSSIMYVCTSTPNVATFKRRPNFKFSDSCLPKLVDYSFSEDEEDSGNDSPTMVSLDESWDQLQMSLDSLTASLGSLDTSRTPLSTGFNRHLQERASLRLKAEMEKERVRNTKVMRHLNSSMGKNRARMNVRKQLGGIFSKAETPSPSLKRQAQSMPVLGAAKQEVDEEMRVCDEGRPSKKRRIDFSVISRFASKRFSFKSKSKKSHQQDLSPASTPTRNCLFSCFKKSSSYTIKKQ